MKQVLVPGTHLLDDSLRALTLDPFSMEEKIGPHSVEGLFGVHV